MSYDPTHELHEQVNAAFSAKTGAKVTVEQSHGRSAKQGRAVMDGLEADVVTLGLAYDVDAIAARGLIAADCSSRLPHHWVPSRRQWCFSCAGGNPTQSVTGATWSNRGFR